MLRCFSRRADLRADDDRLDAKAWPLAEYLLLVMKSRGRWTENFVSPSQLALKKRPQRNRCRSKIIREKMKKKINPSLKEEKT